MKIPMSWLSDYMDIEGITPKEYADRLTMTGSKVEGVENLGDEIENVVTAKILSIQKHPDADKLLVCQMDIGTGEPIQIITGAENVREGQTVPAALDGARLPGGKKIKKGKLRGLWSCGMMCSYQELGLTKEDVPDAPDDGILILDGALPAGKDIKEVFHLDEPVVEFEITSNRPDCLSVIGLARETAVTFGRPFSVAEPVVRGMDGNVADRVQVTVEDQEKCLRYSAKMVKNVKIGPSPKWMADRLRACGIRSINNIVDITNYVLLEYGQPMHAFDMRYLEGGKINVRRAADGEEMTTLDGTPHTLDSSMLMICDAKKPVAVAGVMGGLNSEVQDDTTEVLFESACFDGPSVRVTAKKLGLRTESSSRYEKGLDPENTVPALMRACQLVEELGCGEVVGGMIDEAHRPAEPTRIAFRPDAINAFLGCDISREEMTGALTALGFTVKEDEITVPSFRSDVQCFADVAEEVVRIYGYDKIPSTLQRGETVSAVKTKKQKQEDQARDILTACGFYEIMTFSFANPADFDRLRMAESDPRRSAVKISNPLGEETSIMQTAALPSMLEALARNANFKAETARLFELTRVYLPQEGELLPEEKPEITIGMFGGCDFYDLKGAVETLLDGMNVTKVRFVPVTDNATYHPGRCAALLVGGKQAGILGQVHPAVCDSFGLQGEIYTAELDFAAICAAAGGQKTYQPLPKFPAVVRDLALLADDGVLAADIEEIIRKKAGALFAGLRLFDVYKGKQVPAGKKSMAYSVTLQSADKTLTEEEVSETVNRILEALSAKLGVTLR